MAEFAKLMIDEGRYRAEMQDSGAEGGAVKAASDCERELRNANASINASIYANADFQLVQSRVSEVQSSLLRTESSRTVSFYILGCMYQQG